MNETFNIVSYLTGTALPLVIFFAICLSVAYLILKSGLNALDKIEINPKEENQIPSKDAALVIQPLSSKERFQTYKAMKDVYQKSLLDLTDDDLLSDDALKIASILQLNRTIEGKLRIPLTQRSRVKHYTSHAVNAPLRKSTRQKT